MIIISHRGNVFGPNTASHGENHPDSIENALRNGFNVEIDVSFINGNYMLGHDEPIHIISNPKKFFKNDLLWVHCKNIEAIFILKKISKKYDGSHIFFHDKDDCTLTSTGYIWTYPKNQLLTYDSIAVMPELVPEWNLTNAYGICTDYPHKFIKS